MSRRTRATVAVPRLASLRAPVGDGTFWYTLGLGRQWRLRAKLAYLVLLAALDLTTPEQAPEKAAAAEPRWAVRPFERLSAVIAPNGPNDTPLRHVGSGAVAA